MEKANLMIVFAVLSIFVISACTPTDQKAPSQTPQTEQANGSSQPVQAETTETPKTSQFDYCSTQIKSSQLSLKSKEKGLESLKEDVKKTEDELSKANQDNDLEEKEKLEEDLVAIKRALKESDLEYNEAKQNFDQISSKCETLERKKDKTICQEFIDNIKKELGLANTKLNNDKEDLAKITELLDEAKKSNARPEVISSYDKELQEENFEILKDNNKIDKDNKMIKQLQDYCKLE